MTHRSHLQSALPHCEKVANRNHLEPKQAWAPLAQQSLEPMPIVLLICDEELTRRVLKVVLETAGYRVVEALTVQQGMRQCAPRVNRPEMAIVVSALDHGIWASLDILRSALDQLPLLVMSPDEVGWLLDSLDGREKGYQGQWLGRIQQVLREGAIESPSALHLA